MKKKNEIPKSDAPGVGGGAGNNRAGGPEPKKPKVIDCGAQHITAVCKELMENGVGLRSADGTSQQRTLVRALQFRGERGLNTYEGTAAGYMRIATRVKELKEDWNIYALKEDVIGPDGLLHKGVARYVLMGRRRDLPPPQGQLELVPA